MQYHKAAVYRDTGKCRVSPGTIVAGPGDEIQWKPAGVPDAKIWFPDESIFEEVEQNPLPIGGTLTVAADPRPGVYPYVVICRGESQIEFAEGNSEPRIIIYGRG